MRITKRGQFWFNGRCCSDFGIVPDGMKTYNGPERDIQRVPVLGRNGDLTIDNHRFQNVPIEYKISVCRDFADRADEIRAWLLSSPGYCRLEDTYDPECFRLAR